MVTQLQVRSVRAKFVGGSLNRCPTGNMTALYDALLESLAGDSTERTLRLLIQNIPRFPHDTHLRRLVVTMAVEEGLVDEAQPVVERALAIDIGRGDLLAAASTIGLASTCDLEAEPLWRQLDEAINSRGLQTGGPEPDEAADADLEAMRPLLSRTGLFQIAAEMAARPSSQQPQTFHIHAPFLDALPFEALRELLAQCALVKVADCIAGLPMWALWANADQTWLPAGTLVLDPQCLEPRSMVLQPTPSAWQSLLSNDIAAALWRDVQQSQAAASALDVSAVANALTPSGLQRLFDLGHAVQLEKGIHRTGGGTAGGLGIVLWGEVELVDRAVDPPRVIERLVPGDSFGGEPPATNEVATLELRCGAPAAWLFLDGDHTAELLQSEPAVESLLIEQASRRLAILNTVPT